MRPPTEGGTATETAGIKLADGARVERLEATIHQTINNNYGPSVATPPGLGSRSGRAEDGGSAITSDQPFHEEARTEVAALLRAEQPMLDALTEAMALQSASHPDIAIADRLCPPRPDGFVDALRDLKKGLIRLGKTSPVDESAGKRLREQATAVLEWMLGSAVTDDFDGPHRPEVCAWRLCEQGNAYRMPFERGWHIEIVNARWLRRRALLGERPLSDQAGEDDLTDRLDEIGFDDPERPRHDEDAVNTLFRLLVKVRDGVDPPDRIGADKRIELNTLLEEWHEDLKRHYRFVIDPKAKDNPIHPSAAPAISTAIPGLQVIVLHRDRDAADRVFVCGAPRLIGLVRSCRDLIDALGSDG